MRRFWPKFWRASLRCLGRHRLAVEGQHRIHHLRRGGSGRVVAPAQVDRQWRQHGVAMHHAQAHRVGQPRHSGGRQGGHAEALLDQLHHRRDRRDGVHARRFHAALSAQVQQRHVRLRAALERQQLVLLEQLRQREAFAKVARAHADEDHRHGGKRARQHAVTAGRRGRQHQVGGAALHLVQQHRCGFHGECQFERGVLAAQRLHPFDQPRVQHRFDCPHTQRHRAGRRTRQAAELGLDLSLHVQQPLGVAEEARAGCRQAELLVAAVEHQHAELGFERRDAARQGRLGDEQLLGRTRHALQRDGPVEGFNEAEVHRRGRFMRRMIAVPAATAAPCELARLDPALRPLRARRDA